MAEEISILVTTVLMIFVDFKKVSQEFRKRFNLKPFEDFPALKITDKIAESDEKFVFNIVPDEDWNYKDSIQAYYVHSDDVHEIGIKESVYSKASNGDKGALISIAHEIVHWGLVNYFKFSFGLEKNISKEIQIILGKVHENLVDLVTPLLVFTEEELQAFQSASGVDYSLLGKNQLDLALFYSKNYDVLQSNFKKNIAPFLENHKTKKRRNNTKTKKGFV